MHSALYDVNGKMLNGHITIISIENLFEALAISSILLQSDSMQNAMNVGFAHLKNE